MLRAALHVSAVPLSRDAPLSSSASPTISRAHAARLAHYLEQKPEDAANYLALLALPNLSPERVDQLMQQVVDAKTYSDDALFYLRSIFQSLHQIDPAVLERQLEVQLAAEDRINGEREQPQRAPAPALRSKSLRLNWGFTLTFSLPTYTGFGPILKHCRGSALDATTNRRERCVALGEAMERRASDLLSVYVWQAPQKNALLDAKRIEEIAWRRAQWQKMAAIWGAKTSDTESEDATRAKQALELALDSVRKGEVYAVLDAYAADPSFDAAAMDRLIASGMLPKPVAEFNFEKSLAEAVRQKSALQK